MKKNVVILIFILCLLLLFASCAPPPPPLSIGSGTPGVVAKLDWSEYDSLIEQIRTEPDTAKRALLMHKAEDILMDTGAICPLFYSSKFFMANPSISGYYLDTRAQPLMAYVKKEGSSTVHAQISVEPLTLDAALSGTYDVGVVSRQLFAGLFIYNEKQEITPALADSYTLSDDKCTYVFKLKDNLKWSDGSPLNAKDFEYTWKRNASSTTGADFQNLYSYIKGYPDNLEVSTSDDAQTLTVVLNNPCAYFLDLCSIPAYFPIKQSQVESADGYKDANGKVVNPGAWAKEAGIISNGPFTVQSWTHNESMILKKNPYFYEADKVLTETLDLMLTADASTAYSAFLVDDLDIVSQIPTDELKNVKNNPGFQFVTLGGTAYVTYNIKSTLFASFTAEEAKTMRKAFSIVPDRQFIIDVVLETGNQPATSFVSPKISDGNGKEFKRNTQGYTYPVDIGYYPEKPDIAKAREMLKSIGFTFDDNGKLTTPLTIDYKVNPGLVNEGIGACLQADFDQLGINITVSTEDWNVFVKDRSNGAYESARGSWSSDYNDALGMLEMFSSSSSYNDPQFGK